jgi:type IX secretion system PorP/SprF family membrane protein
MKKILIITAVLVCLPFTGRAQDNNILFSQYNFNGLTLNPAYAGSHDLFSASFLSRHQWLGFNGAPKDFALNLHGPGKNTKTGWGANMMYETIGLRSTFSLYANYAYRLMLGPGTLAMGLKGGFVSGNQKIDDLIGSDPVYNESASDYFLPNFGIGLYYNTPRIFAGISAPLLVGYKSSSNGSIVAKYNNFSMYTYYLTAGVHLQLSDAWQITPSFLARYQSSTRFVLDGTLNVLYRELIGAGISYRTSGALIAMLSYRIGYQTTIGLAYDFGIGGINKYNEDNRSSFEIAIQVDLGFKLNRTNPIVF